MIESMAGKSASMHGLVHDATPFTFSEDVSAIDYFGKMLVKGEVPMRTVFLRVGRRKVVWGPNDVFTQNISPCIDTF